MSRFPLAVLVAGLLTLPAPTSAPAQEENRGEPVPSDLTEEVEVRIATLPILVTDKRGRPIDDLKLEEVHVKEGGKKRRVAFLEPFRTRDTIIPAVEEEPGGEAVPRPEAAVPEAQPVEPPLVQRHIVFLFDARNSRLPNRLKWAAGARKWVQDEMAAGDRVAIAVYDGDLEYVVPFTSERYLLESSLGNPHYLEKGNLDRREQMSDLMENLTTCDLAFDQRNCAIQAVQNHLFEWSQETRTTLEALGSFIAGLGAMPGRKMIIYGSEGFITDPGGLATSAILAEFGTDKMSVSDLRSILSQDAHRNLLRLFARAANAGTAFFPIDVRSIADRDWLSDAGEEFQLHERQLVNPMAEIFDMSRGALSSIASSSGGRAYFGADAPRRISEAISSSRGLYNVGYYSEGAPGQKVRIKIDRKNAEVSDPGGSTAARPPRPLVSEVAVFTPQPRPDGYVVPVGVEVGLADLPFEKAADGWGLQLSVYASLVDRRGAVAGESFEILDVAISDDEYHTRATRKFRHVIGVTVPAGVYRARARVTDHNLTVRSDRLVAEELRVPSASPAESASPHDAGSNP